MKLFQRGCYRSNLGESLAVMENENWWKRKWNVCSRPPQVRYALTVELWEIHYFLMNYFICYLRTLSKYPSYRQLLLALVLKCEQNPGILITTIYHTVPVLSLLGLAAFKPVPPLPTLACTEYCHTAARGILLTSNHGVSSLCSSLSSLPFSHRKILSPYLGLQAHARFRDPLPLWSHLLLLTLSPTWTLPQWPPYFLKINKSHMCLETSEHAALALGICKSCFFTSLGTLIKCHFMR